MKDLLPYATPRQAEIIRAILAHGSYGKAARALGITRGYVANAVIRARARAAKRGYSPEEDAAGISPEGYHVKGKSILYGPKGEVKQYWLKTDKDRQSLAQLAEEISDALQIPLAPKTRTPVLPPSSDQLAVYPIGDAHIGMLAWGEETGKDFDLQIAQRELVAAAGKLTSLAPRTGKALVINVGDYFHTDNYHNRTERSGHHLDADSRWPKMVRVGILCMRLIIDQALRRHKEVEVINAAGNHDRQTSYLLSLVLEAHYRDEPRVKVRTEPTAFHYLRFGGCLVGVTHGDRVKPQDLPGIMAVDRAEDWGATQYRYWYTGHVHHDQRKEYRGCMFESFRTLASSDAWHKAAGYRSGSDMKCIVLDPEHGEVLRHTVGLSQIGG